jgi:hypothetical protein
MKPPLSVPIRRGDTPSVSGLHKRHKSLTTLLMVAIAVGVGSGDAYSQGTPPGNYYQSNPPGSGITGANYNELAYVSAFLPPATPPLSLYSPVPPGSQAASTSQLAMAVTAAANNLLSASPSPAVPAGVTLASIAVQMAANNPTAATASSGTLAALASSIIAKQTAANAFTSLTTVITSLAATYPTTLSTLSAPIFNSAAANASQAGNIPQLALTATTTNAAISSNDQLVGGIVAQAINAASGASGAQALMQSVVATQLGSATINSSQASIAAIAKSMVDGTAVAAISNPNLAGYVKSALTSLPAASQTNANAGAIYLGMVASGTIPEATITGDLQSGATGSESTYLGAMHTGYTSTAGNIASNLATNTDAVIAGAVMSGTVSESTLITDAFTSGTTTAVQNIVAAAITSDLVKNTVDNSSVIAADAVAATGAGNYTLVAQGAVGAGRASDAGVIAASMIKATPGYSPTASSVTASFTTTNISNVVAGALAGAYDGISGSTYINSKSSAVAQIVYQAEMASSAFTFTGTAAQQAAQASSLLPQAEAVLTTAISTMKNLDTADAANLPTFMAAAAVFAGYGGPATNLPTIASYATGSPSGNVTADSSPAAVTAINAVEPVVQNYRTLSSTGYTYTMNALGTNSTAPDSVLAILYGASLASSIDSSALLAAAVAKVPDAMGSANIDSDANLLAAAVNANPSNQAGLTIANAVAMHIETNLVANNNNDISNYVGFQVAQNPTYSANIAAAAVSVDPNQANYVARALGYNNPQTGYLAIPSIFAYSQLTSKLNDNGGVHIGESGTSGQPSNTSTKIDVTSAAAAIAAGYATGVVEAAQSPTLAPSGTNTVIEQALVNGVSQAVGAAISQNNTTLTGASFLQAPNSLSALPGSPTITVNGSGVPSYSGTNTSRPSVGAAGVVTGVIAQLVTAGDTTLGGTAADATALNTTPTTALSIVNAILKATVFTVQNGLPTATLNATNNGYVTQIAQAAGQAFGYISGNGTNSNNMTTAQDVSVADQIAGDLTTSTSASNYNLVLYAAYFGITQGQSGVIGAGAAGVSQNGNYSQNGGTNTPGNPTGGPVTDIFNL